ncbi:hypothetical protein HB777_25875 [Mesorhizobium loti]|nr:hypothetical protein HB777_25875 [Mesorhizobium loti]
MYSANSRFRNFEDRVPQRRPSTRQTFSSISRSAADHFQDIDVGTLLHEIAPVHHVISRPSGVELVFNRTLTGSTYDHRKAARSLQRRAGGLPAAELDHVRDTNIPITATMQIILIK